MLYWHVDDADKRFLIVCHHRGQVLELSNVESGEIRFEKITKLHDELKQGNLEILANVKGTPLSSSTYVSILDFPFDLI